MLEASAVRIVEDILANLRESSMAEKVKLLGKLDVVRDDKADVTSAPQTFVTFGVLGGPGAPPAIDVSPSSTGLMKTDGTPLTVEEAHRARAIVMIGTPPPGTPLNPLPVGRATTEHR
jgi:hypothetical protein